MNNFDLVVIGGGPAGMMGAVQASLRGAKVLLLEKNKTLGKKIYITGKGRCNVTQAQFDVRTLIKSYGENGAFLFSPFHQFGPEDLMNFFEELGVKLKVERGGRVFPVSDDSAEIVNTLEKFLKKTGVEILYGTKVKEIKIKENVVEAVVTEDGKVIKTKNVIVATGGLSYPVTGCTGDGYLFAKKLGHKIVDTKPALVPLRVKETWVKEMQGLSLKNVELTAWSGKKKIASRQGEMLFTHFGVSGPIVLDMSKYVLMQKQPVELTINFKPALDLKQLDERLQRDFKKYSNKQFKNILGDLLPRLAIPVFLKLSEIDPDRPVHSITREERIKFRDLLSTLKLHVVGDLGYSVAIVTTGGIYLKEIDPKTMGSKIIENLYFAGEVLDIDGPTGGYNLQVAWSTGFVAGNAVKW